MRARAGGGAKPSATGGRSGGADADPFGDGGTGPIRAARGGSSSSMSLLGRRAVWAALGLGLLVFVGFNAMHTGRAAMRRVRGPLKAAQLSRLQHLSLPPRPREGALSEEDYAGLTLPPELAAVASAEAAAEMPPLADGPELPPMPSLPSASDAAAAGGASTTSPDSTVSSADDKTGRKTSSSSAPQAVRHDARGESAAALAAVALGPDAGPRPEYFDMRRTPEFTVVAAGAKTADGRELLVLEVPMYVSVFTTVQHPLQLARLARRVRATVASNATSVTRLVVQPIFIDNTGCDRSRRVRHEAKPHFESHAEMNPSFDCPAWEALKAGELTRKLKVEVLRPPVPLPFGPTMNYMQRHALDVRGAPRFMWAHHDAQPASFHVLEAIAKFTAMVTEPFCIFFSGPWPANHDVVAVFDAVSLMEHVGDWDNYLWYYGDNDYYDRCSIAQLPYGDMSHHGFIAHTVSAAKKSFKGKTRRRFDAMDKMFEFFRHRKQDALFGQAPAMPPADSIVVRATWRNEANADVGAAAVALSAHVGRWMRPYRYVLDALPCLNETTTESSSSHDDDFNGAHAEKNDRVASLGNRNKKKAGGGGASPSSVYSSSWLNVKCGELFGMSAEFILEPGPKDVEAGNDEGLAVILGRAGRDAWQRARGAPPPPAAADGDDGGVDEPGDRPADDGRPQRRAAGVDWSEATLLALLQRAANCSAVSVLRT